MTRWAILGLMHCNKASARPFRLLAKLVDFYLDYRRDVPKFLSV